MAGRETVFTAAALAERVGGRLVGPGDLVVRGIDAFDDAGPDDITFIASAAYARRWGAVRAGAAVVSAGLEPDDNDATRRALIHVPDAEVATATLLALFADEEPRPAAGVDPAAWVHETVDLGPDVAVGPHASVDRDCVIGGGTVIHPGARLYRGVTVGEGCVLHANVVVRRGCRIGNRVIIHQNASIGADGFGYRPAPDGSGLVKMPHIGGVRLEDDVEIGAGTCVDRGKFGDTVVGAGTKIDNLVQIAHNVRIGRSCVIAGLSAVAGSTVLGDGVLVGGASGVTEHRRIGTGARLGAASNAMDDIPDGETWIGSPAGPRGQILRQHVALRKLPDLMKRLGRRAAVEDRSPTSRGTSDRPAD